MVIFLNKIIFLAPVKDSLLPTNLCQGNQSRSRPVSQQRWFPLFWGQWSSTGVVELEGLPEELDLQEADLHDNHHYGSSLVPASTLNQMQFNFNSSERSPSMGCSTHFANLEWRQKVLVTGGGGRLVKKLNRTEKQKLEHNLNPDQVYNFGACWKIGNGCPSL